ncbi:MAG: YARHG domain-containing protein [Clostridia bacterium]|nr:YARHG domain-containing protein [Clostridia bacterium]
MIMDNKIAKIRSLTGVLVLIVAVCCCFTSCGDIDLDESNTSVNEETTVSAMADEAVVFVNKEITVNVGDTSQLLATGIDSSADADAVKWSSSDTSVAKVDNGIVTGVSAGTTTVTVLFNNRYDTCIVRVTEGETISQSKYEKDYDLATEYLSDEIYDWSIKEIQTSINLILARNHYKFKSQDWLDYFSQYIWYTYDTTDMDRVESRFNKIEEANYNALAKARNVLKNQNYIPDYSYDEKYYEYAMYHIEGWYDINYWSNEEIQLAINTILARNHYEFKKKEWRDYFGQFSWYYSNTSSMSTAESRFNAVERANYDYLAKLRD